MVFAVGACSSVPRDGPSAKAIVEGAAKQPSYALVDLDYKVQQAVSAHPVQRFATLAPVSSNQPVDLIGPGDVLSVWIYEAGAGPAPTGRGPPTPDQSQSLPAVMVDRGGAITVPFAGEVQVAGLTARQATERVQQALRGRAINPQVIVGITASATNSVTVLGDVRTPGRFPLAQSSGRLLDVLAMAGGPTKPAPDTQVTIVRGARSVSATLRDVLDSPGENVRLAPGDQVQLKFKPRRFSTFGAFAKAQQIDIEEENLSLASAISRIGGLDTNSADAKSVMLFRLERPEVAQAIGLPSGAEGKSPIPIIYRLNLREPGGFFVASAFEVRPDDLIYVPRSDVTELKKFLDLAGSISRVAYDVAITTVLP